MSFCKDGGWTAGEIQREMEKETDEDTLEVSVRAVGHGCRSCRWRSPPRDPEEVDAVIIRCCTQFSCGPTMLAKLRAHGELEQPSPSQCARLGEALLGAERHGSISSGSVSWLTNLTNPQ